MQGKASGNGWRRRGRAARGNENHVFPVREGNDGSLPANARTPGVLPGVLPGKKVDGSRVVWKIELRKQRVALAAGRSRRSLGFRSEREAGSGLKSNDQMVCDLPAVLYLRSGSVAARVLGGRGKFASGID